MKKNDGTKKETGKKKVVVTKTVKSSKKSPKTQKDTKNTKNG